MKPYLDFELSIQRDGEGYCSRVLKAPAGEAAGTFSHPFSDLELENFLLRIGGRRQSMRRIDSPEVQAARIFGERLFRAAFPEGVRDCLRGSLDIAKGEAGLRIRLRLNDVPELADLPWEYLWDPLRKRFLALSTDTPIVRYLEVPERIRPLEIQPPLRILTMIASPAGVEPLDTEKEWALLSTALKDLIHRGRITLDRLEKATLVNLHRRLRQGDYHILHFIGHGAFDERAQDSVLVLEDEQGKVRMVSGQDFATLLQDRKTLRLAVLNSCEGARATRTDPFAGTAQSLVQGGVPAVIAMQFEISDQAAITFATEFYQAVAEGFPIDTALAEARLAIFAQGNGLEWGTPVLYLRAPDGRIFDVETKSSTEPPTKPEPVPAPPRISSQAPKDRPVPPPKQSPPLPKPASSGRAAIAGGWSAELWILVSITFGIFLIALISTRGCKKPVLEVEESPGITDTGIGSLTTEMGTDMTTSEPMGTEMGTDMTTSEPMGTDLAPPPGQ